MGLGVTLHDPSATPEPDELVGVSRVSVKLSLPEPVATWLQTEAQRRYKHRGRYISDMLVELYRKSQA